MRKTLEGLSEVGIIDETNYQTPSPVQNGIVTIIYCCFYNIGMIIIIM